MNIDNKVKELEAFLDDKTVLKSIFGTENPLDLDETESKVKRMQYVQTEMKPIEKPHKPRKSTIVNSRENKECILISNRIRSHLRDISPFPLHNNTTQDRADEPNTGRYILEILLPFSSKQLCVMESNKKEEVIETLLFRIKPVVRKHRMSFFYNGYMYGNKGFMFSGDFEENKLKYLVKNGEEPIIVSEDDYDFLEEQYMIFMRKLIHRMFEEAYYSGGEEELDFGKKDDDILFEFMHACAKRFSYLNKEVFSSLSSRYINDLLYAIDEKDIDFSSYHTLHCCPITDRLRGFKTDIIPSREWVYDMVEVTCIEPSRLFKLLTKENYVYFMDEIMSYLKLVLGYDMNFLDHSSKRFFVSIRRYIIDDKVNFYKRLFYHFEYYMKMQKQQTI
ncbi:hypothetical protein ACWKTZ_26555 [Bacillus cereus]